jgi:acyl-CoA thioesterase FadM
MRWLRLLIALITARFRPALKTNGYSEMKFNVWITDVDAAIMNHAAMMTVMEAGRIDFMMRSGFFRLARINKWYVPSAAISVQFMRPLKLFQQAVLITRVFHVNDQWIYLEQRIARKGKDIACCIVKSTIKKNRDHISIFKIMDQLGNADWPQQYQELIEQYELHLLQLKESMQTGEDRR